MSFTLDVFSKKMVTVFVYDEIGPLATTTGPKIRYTTPHTSQAASLCKGFCFVF